MSHALPEEAKVELGREFEDAFRTELGERIRAMRAALVVLERDPPEPERASHVDALVRHAHSLKGAAQVMGRARLAAVTGALEKRLRTAPYDGKAARNAVDAIVGLAEQLGTPAWDQGVSVAAGPHSRAHPPTAKQGAGDRAVRPLRILHVEDGPVNRALVQAIFARTTEPLLRECVLLNAESLADARAILESESVDLVLLDLRLPDGDGLELARELRNSAASRVPIVVVSATVPSAEQAAALSEVADQFISKPLDPAHLVATVGRLAVMADRAS